MTKPCAFAATGALVTAATAAVVVADCVGSVAADPPQAKAPIASTGTAAMTRRCLKGFTMGEFLRTRLCL